MQNSFVMQIHRSILNPTLYWLTMMIWSPSGLMGKENQVSDMQMDDQKSNSDHASPKFSINGFLLFSNFCFLCIVLVGWWEVRQRMGFEVLRFYDVLVCEEFEIWKFSLSLLPHFLSCQTHFEFLNFGYFLILLAFCASSAAALEVCANAAWITTWWLHALPVNSFTYIFLIMFLKFDWFLSFKLWSSAKVKMRERKK